MKSTILTLRFVLQRLFSAEELSLFNGTDEGLPILLGILGYTSLNSLNDGA